MLRKNSQIILAENFLRETGAGIFLTGKAGTGKTTFLREMANTIPKRMVIAAPTAVAAINARGVTLHSLFQLPFGVITKNSQWQQGDNNSFILKKMGRNKRALIRSIEVLVIDEISMVRCDVLDAVDEVLRQIRHSKLPFGGVQLLMIGDIHQLSPICRDDEWEILRHEYPSPYFFESKALKSYPYVTIELQEIFRQTDRHFTDLLNAVRDNNITGEVINALNARYIPNFQPPKDESYITLCTHNHSANYINSNKLSELSTRSHYFDAEVKGDYNEWAYPTEKRLELKVGAQVIFIKNDASTAKEYYNGMIGEVISIENGEISVKTKDGGRIVNVSKIGWENIEYKLNEQNGNIEEKVKGVFSQVPLRCAWAITIHKSQGLTFERAIIDAASSFAHGQVYVALSRCRTFEGMVLSRPLSPNAFMRDGTVDGFCTEKQSEAPSEKELEAHKRNYFSSLLCEVFDYENLSRIIDSLSSLFGGFMARSEEQLSTEIRNIAWTIDKEIVEVGRNFQLQLRGAVESANDYTTDGFIKDRLAKASHYFTAKLSPIKELTTKVRGVVSENKEVIKRLTKLKEELFDEIKVKMFGVELCATGFSVEGYTKGKFEILSHVKPSAKNERDAAKTSENITCKIVNDELFEELKEWRRAKGEEIGDVPLYTVLTNRAIEEIQCKLPTTIAELSSVNGMGKKRVESYGDELLKIVNNYINKKNIDMNSYKSEMEKYITIIPPTPKIEKVKSESRNMPTYLVTYERYKAGNNIVQIAQERGLAISTIEGHIAKLIKENKLNINDFVSEDKVSDIAGAITETESISLTEIKEKLNNKYSYFELKCALSSLGIGS